MAVRRKTNPAESVKLGDFGGSCADVEVESADGAEVVLTCSHGNTTEATNGISISEKLTKFAY